MTENAPLFWGILVGYLALLAVIGWYSSKKTKSLEDFLVAGRSINSVLLGLSFGVTYFSAVLLVGGGLQSYEWGLSTLWIAAINVFVGVFLAFVFFGRRTKGLSQHLGAMTIPDLLADRYRDSKLRVLSALVILVFETVYLVSIYIGLSVLMGVIMPDTPHAYEIAVIVCGVITVIYLTMGGSHGAILTDVIEAVIMVAGVVLIAGFGLHHIAEGGGFAGATTLYASLHAQDPQLVSYPGTLGWGLLGMMLVTSFGVWGSPQAISRFYTAKKKNSIKWALVISCTWAVVISFFAYLNGNIARAIPEVGEAIGALPAGTSNPSEYSVPFLMMLVLPPVFAALFIAAVTAASLTTGEKVVLMAASAFSRDIYQKTLRPEASDEQVLKVTRIVLTILVTVAVILAIQKPSAILALCTFAWAALASVILVPYVFGLFWKGGTAKAAFISGLLSFGTAIAWWVLFRRPLMLAGDLATDALFDTAFGPLRLAYVHEFLVSQVVAVISFPILSKVTAPPPREFVDDLFVQMGR